MPGRQLAAHPRGHRSALALPRPTVAASHHGRDGHRQRGGGPPTRALRRRQETVHRAELRRLQRRRSSRGELFGHEAGALHRGDAQKGRRARARTRHWSILFLDEVRRSLSLESLSGQTTPRPGASILQARRRRAAFSVTTNARAGRGDESRTLWAEVAAGRFRPDLYQRLRHFVRLPALRERPEDIPLLLERLGAREDERLALDSRAIRRLALEPWAGNVRELRFVLELILLDARRTTDDEVIVDESAVEHALSAARCDGEKRASSSCALKGAFARESLGTASGKPVLTAVERQLV